MKISRTASLGSNFAGSYKKVPQQEEGKHYNVIKEILYRSGGYAICFFIFRMRESAFFYRVINKTKLSVSKTVPKTLRSLEV